jgi:glycosyltransferase involved in cell wall biosynthesis
MNLPTLSVIIPNYNHSRYLNACLTALVEQSAPAAEIIVVDDASTDNSVEVIEAFARQHAHLRLVRNAQNLGVVGTVNKGLELASGEYVYCGSADDQVLPGFFEKSMRLLAQYPEAAGCCTIGDWREMASGYRWHVAVGMAEQACYLSPSAMVRLEQRDKLFIPSHTVIMRRSALLAVGRFIPELRWHSDWFAMYLAGFRHGMCYVPEPLAQFNIHPTSFYTRGRQGEEHRKVILGMLERLNRPEFQEAAERIRESGALYLFAGPMLRAILGHPEYRRFLNATFLRKNLWHIFKLKMKKILPAGVARWYFRTFYRAKNC